MKVSGVYGIVHRPTGRVYVGSSCNVNRRWRDHVGNLNKGRHSSVQLLDLWLLDGPGAFAFVLLESCPREILREREQEWLDSFESALNTSRDTRCPMFDPVVAARVGAKNKISCLGRVISPETRRKISEANRGRVMSESTRAKMRQRRWSPEQRVKISTRLKGHAVSSKTRVRQSEAAHRRWAKPEESERAAARLRGRRNSAISKSNRRRFAKGYRIRIRDKALWRERLSISHRGQSRSHSEETKKKMSESARRRHAERHAVTSLITKEASRVE